MSLLEDFAQAISLAKSKTVASLLKNGSVDVNARLPCRFSTPLVFAAECKQPAIVELLLSAGARTDIVDERGCTACHFAVQARSVDMMAVLIAHRANLDIKDGSGRTPLQLSINIHADNTTVMLIDAGASLAGVPDYVLCYLATKSTAMIQALLNRHIAVSELRDQLHDDFTPLHMVASQSRRASAEVHAIVNMLVNVCGVDVNARTSRGLTCLHLMTSDGNSDSDAFRCFINAGADVNSLDDAGRPLLHHALYNGYELRNTRSMMRVSAKANTNFDARDRRHALGDGEMSCKHLMMLIAAGANVDARDRRGGRGRTAFERLRVRIKTDPPRWVLPAFIAAGADLSALKPRIIAAVSAEEVEAARRDIAKARLDFVRHRALQVCIGLQSLEIDALQMCEILQFACGPLAPLIAFHHWWKIATAVKHFH